MPVAEKNWSLEIMLRDLIEARERLAANSSTNPRPPNSDQPWLGPCGDSGTEDAGRLKPQCQDKYRLPLQAE